MQDFVNEAITLALGEPVAWRVKDYADDWILFNSYARAMLEQKMTDALMQALYAPKKASE